MTLQMYLEKRWSELTRKLTKRQMALLDLSSAESQNFLNLLWTKQYWEEAYLHLEKKVQHGCTDAFCPICDKEYEK